MFKGELFQHKRPEPVSSGTAASGNSTIALNGAGCQTRNSPGTCHQVIAGAPFLLRRAIVKKFGDEALDSGSFWHSENASETG